MRFGCRDFALGAGNRPLVIAEVGVNHNGDLDRARAMVDAAMDAGADVVKFQAFRSAREISRHAPLAEYQKGGECAPDRGSQPGNQPDNQPGNQPGNQLDLCSALELSPEALTMLRDYCDRRGAPSLFAAFEWESLDFLVQGLGLATVKIPSGEVTNLPLLRQAGRSGVSVILSTGASDLDEVGLAVETLRQAGCRELMLFHCVSEYPAPPEQVNLRAMHAMATAFGVPVGFSDHTEGVAAAIAASALGAAAIEKHFTLDRTLPGPDHQASIEPQELALLARGARLAWLALGDGKKVPQPCELANRPLIRKGLVAARNLPAGTLLALADLEIKRPEAGIAPARLEEVLGRRLARALAEDEPLNWDDLA